MKNFLSFIAVFVSIATFAQGSQSPMAMSAYEIITQWTFDGSTTTPNEGSGTASLVGGVTSSFATGNGGGQGLNLTGFPAQEVGSATSGVQFLLSTVGYENIKLEFDHRASGTASRYAIIQYTTNGSTWVALNNNDGGLIQDTFVTFFFDFSSIPAVNNNPNFGVRILSVFSDCEFRQNSTLTYSANQAYMRANNNAACLPHETSNTGNYAANGTWRFDNVSFLGEISNVVVPVLSALPTTLIGFNYVQNEGPSSSQTIQVSASNLNPLAGNIVLTAPTNFELSLDGLVYTSSIMLSYTDGNLSLSDVNVRLVAGLNIGNYSGNVNIEGADASPTTVSLSAEVTAPMAPFMLPFENDLRSQADLNEALNVGFTTNNAEIVTTAGGYLHLLNVGSSNFTSPFVFNNDLVSSGVLNISFSLATFGAGSNRQVELQRVNQSGQLIEVLETYQPTTSTYINVAYELDLSNISETFSLRVAYVSGTAGSIRFRDIKIEEVISPLEPGIDPLSCGVEYTFLPYEFIQAIEVPFATQYEFRLQALDYDQTFATSNAQARVYDFIGYQYGTIYQVSVRVLVDNVWSDFSPSCQISTVAEPITEVQIIPCGSTLDNISTNIYFKAVVGSSMYHYEVTNTSTNDVQTLNLSTRFFRISMLDNFSYGTTYSVRARVTFNDVLMPFGPSCDISTPAILTELRPISCGAEIPNQSALIHARGVVGANLYDFEITNTIDNSVLTVQSSTPNFSLSQMSTQPVLGVVYSVRVRASVNNVFGAYGNACNVSVALPTTKLRPSSCDAVLPNNNTPIYANSVVNATGYEFEITHPVTEVVEIVSRLTRVFSLGMMSTAVTPNTTYSIRVRATVNGQLTQFGDVCTVTTPMQAQQVSKIAENVVEANAFEVNAFPNPFSEDVTLIISSSNTESVVQIFDLTGKLVLNQTVNTTHFKVGSELNAGVYLIRITNGIESKTLKVVKK